MAADKAIRFQAQVFKLATLIDGGMRLTLDIQATPQAIMDLLKAKQPGAILEIAAVPVLPSLTNGKKDTERRAARNPLDVVGG